MSWHELGVLNRAWMRHSRGWNGALTGKPLCPGGSRMRTEATGYGLIHFPWAMPGETGDEIAGATGP